MASKQLSSYQVGVLRRMQVGMKLYKLAGGKPEAWLGFLSSSRDVTINRITADILFKYGYIRAVGILKSGYHEYELTDLGKRVV